MSKEIFVAFGVDVDAVGGWLGSYGGENSPDDISGECSRVNSAFPGCLSSSAGGS